jgi:hypothetical protein
MKTRDVVSILLIFWLDQSEDRRMDTKIELSEKGITFLLIYYALNVC